MKIKELDEFHLITRLTRGLGSQSGVALGIGDDCAVLDLQGDMLLLATCDSQVEGVHFTLETLRPEQIGRKALAVNLSDIAAMGGEPRYALVSLILPAQLPLELLEGIYAGLRQEAELFGTAIIGGNISGAGEGGRLAIDITLLGATQPGRLLTRSGARIGDILCVTGTLGDSAAGLYTLLYPHLAYPAQALEAVRDRHRLPRPRVQEGRTLASLPPGTITAMLDISDGLSGDLGHLCASSKVGACLDLKQLPLSPELLAIAKSVGHAPVEWALHGGEDYELLFTVSAGSEQEACQTVAAATGTVVTPIGTIRPMEDGIRVRFSEGGEEPLEAKSWNHLRNT